jgi:hypothetical protein
MSLATSLAIAPCCRQHHPDIAELPILSSISNHIACADAIGTLLSIFTDSEADKADAAHWITAFHLFTY